MIAVSKAKMARELVTLGCPKSVNTPCIPGDCIELGVLPAVQALYAPIPTDGTNWNAAALTRDAATVQALRPEPPTYVVGDGNACEKFDTLDEAIECCEEWYGYMQDGERELPDLDVTSVTDVDSLNLAIGRWERAIAEACGVFDFAGHGNYYVTGADRMGLGLTVHLAYGVLPKQWEA